jgi:alcohol dehydrogenase class IV
MSLYDQPQNPPLPLAAIPTTAGTGSEVNAYAVLTIPELGVKRTYSSPLSFPTVAFLDPRYTASLPHTQTVSTALDAFCHCAESYFSPKSTALTRALCVKGADMLWRGLCAATETNPDEQTRETLLTGAMLGGLVIAHTGTGYPHPMGYNLTLSLGIPHGAACAFFEEGYLRLQASSHPALYGDFVGLAGLPGDFAATLTTLAGPAPKLRAQDIGTYAALIAGAGNFANAVCAVPNDAESIAKLYEETFRQ